MPSIRPLPDAVLERICAVLGDTESGLTGREIGELLNRSRIDDIQPGITKRRRLFAALQARQVRDHSANTILAFIMEALAPARHAGQLDVFESRRTSLNETLIFAGLEFGEDGQFTAVTEARTLTEAQRRAKHLRAGLVARNVHPDVLRFCRAELVADDYFHAVLEATKSVADKLRIKTGLDGDGNQLVDAALGGKQPLVAINTLRTGSERSEQAGLASLIRGVFQAFRNPTAHEPRVSWPIEEQDAIDLLTLASFIHRKLDAAVPTNPVRPE